MAEEDEQTFVGGSPNSEGVSNAELALVAETLKRAADGALVIVGLHAPLSIRGAMTTRITCAKPSVLCSGGTYPRICVGTIRRTSTTTSRITPRQQHPSWFAPSGVRTIGAIDCRGSAPGRRHAPRPRASLQRVPDRDVLKNADDASQFYVGLTSDVKARLVDHNAGRCPHTASRRTWQLHVAVELPDEERAIRFERYLKSGSGRAFAKRHFEP